MQNGFTKFYDFPWPVDTLLNGLFPESLRVDAESVTMTAVSRNVARKQTQTLQTQALQTQ